MAGTTDYRRGSADRAIRVFISSTFRDMQSERDELVKRVFPKLRSLCEARGVTWGEVDLRWGISDEQSAEGQVLPICLEEIERCRPYFIGLLGERYGWVPDTVAPELIERQPWLEEHLGHSVTELEIIHGVLRDRDMADFALFYFRDPAYLDQLPEAERRAFSEDPGSEAAAKLAALKDRIRASELPLKENYAGPQQLGAWVYDDLCAIIDRRFPESEIPDPLDREAADHESIGQRLSALYIGGEDYFRRLDEHADGDGPPLAVLGESGSGKSALLATWARRYRAAHPDTPLVLHFTGSSPFSADWERLLRRVMGELKRHFMVPDEIPARPEELLDAFPQWLAAAAAQGRCIIVLDAVNQLEDSDAALDLGWLPREIPANVRLILSTLPGRPLDAIEARGWPALTVTPLDPPARERLIREYLGQYRKSLSAGQVDRIANDPETANPLFLKALLEEIRVFGVYEALDDRIEHYLAAQSIPELYRRILKRYEEDYELHRPGLVRNVMRYLWAARRGLSESELLDLLGSGGVPLPQAYWSPLALASNQSIVNRSGLLGFGHDYLRQAVAEEYLPEDTDRRTAHLELADYFESREIGDRKADELPWQLMKGGNGTAERLKSCLTDIELFKSLNTIARKPDLRQYWLSLDDRYDVVEAYEQALDRHERHIGESPELVETMNGIGLFLEDLAKLDGAERVYRRAVEAAASVYEPDHEMMGNLSNNLASLLYRMNRIEESLPLYYRAIEIFAAVGGSEEVRVGIALSNASNVLRALNRSGEAEVLLRRALDMHESEWGAITHQTAVTLNNLAGTLFELERFDEAEATMRRAIEVARKVYGPLHPDMAAKLNNLAVMISKMGRTGEAQDLHREAIRIAEEAYGHTHPSVATYITGLANMLCDLDRQEDAEPLYLRALEIFDATHATHHPDVALVLGNLAGMYREMGRYEEAESLYRRAVEVSEASLAPDDPLLASRIHNLATTLAQLGQSEEAESLLRRALALFEAGGETQRAEVAQTAKNLAALLKGLDRFDDAEPYYRQALSIDEAMLGPEDEDVAVDLNNLAEELRDNGHADEAEPLHRRAVEIMERVYGSGDENIALYLFNHSETLFEAGRPDEAETVRRRMLELYLAITADAGEVHPDLRLAAHHYSNLLNASGLDEDTILERLRELFEEYDISLG